MTPGSILIFIFLGWVAGLVAVDEGRFDKGAMSVILFIVILLLAANLQGMISNA